MYFSDDSFGLDINSLDVCVDSNEMDGLCDDDVRELIVDTVSLFIAEFIFIILLIYIIIGIFFLFLGCLFNFVYYLQENIFVFFVDFFG